MPSVFDQKVDRSGPFSWLKDDFTPQPVKEAGLLGFAGAEFEFPTCPAIAKGIRELAEKGIYGFTLPGEGYYNAIIWWMKEVRGCDIQPEWILPTHGTIYSLATSIRLVTQPGENIMILTPGYHRYEQAATRLGRGTVKIPLADKDGRYFMDWDALENAMARPENKILVLTNPNNPTGTIFPREDLERIAALSRKYGVLVYSDEIFADITFHGKQALLYADVAEENDLAISCTALGKTFSMTGVNHANVLIKNAQLRQQFHLQRNADHYGSIDPFLHAALVSVYSPEGKQWLQELKEYVWSNYEFFKAFFRSRFPEIVISEPEGSFVVWADFTATGMTAEQLDQLLCKEGLFVGDPGEEFYGREACFRYSLAVPRCELERSLARLDAALKNYR